MPHVSKHLVAEKVLRELEEHIIAVLSDTGLKARNKIFKEILTKTERLMVAKRLAMIYLIQKGRATHEISEMLKVSPSTVARFENQLEQKCFIHTASWVKNHVAMNRVFKLIFNLAAVPFEAQKKSLGQMLDEN
ncbi:MAG: helix-turn-helix domain-containing protein [Patescibacteria group bacterium]